MLRSSLGAPLDVTLASLRVVVPWGRVALGLGLPVPQVKPLPNPVVRNRETNGQRPGSQADADAATRMIQAAAVPALSPPVTSTDPC